MAQPIQTHDGIHVRHYAGDQCRVIDSVSGISFTVTYNETAKFRPTDPAVPIAYDVEGTNMTLRELLAYTRKVRANYML